MCDFRQWLKQPRLGAYAAAFESWCTATVLALALLATAVAAGGAAAEPGVGEDKILFGQSAAFQGPAAALGVGVREGILAAFLEANSAGGVHGRRLELIARDDGYEPTRAIDNTKKLIHDDQVFALLGEVGTPTSKAVQPIATAAGVPFIGPFTGAGFLRDPRLRNVINIRASYDQETEAWIRYLVDELGLSRVAILYQDDSFGRAGLSGVVRALDRRAMALVAEGTYMRNTTAIKTAFLAIRRSDPQAVVMVGAYKPCAAFIRLARRFDLDALFVNISFVGSKALAKELDGDGVGVIVTQVVPLPDDRAVPLVARYRDALLASSPDTLPGFVSLEGYLIGLLVVAALREAGPDVTRERLLATIYEVGTFDFGGVTLTYGPGDNQGMDRVFPTVIGSDGGFGRLGAADP
jgi:ABC-type branched-subunit amino acid transport system substrate-binding protein